MAKIHPENKCDEEDICTIPEIVTVKPKGDVTSNGVDMGAKSLFGALNFSFSLAGLFFAPFRCKKEKKRTCHWSFLYNILVLVLLLMKVIFYLISFRTTDGGNRVTIFKIIISTWSTLCLLNGVICVRASHPKYGHIQEFLNYWDNKIETSFAELGITFDRTKIWRKMVVKRSIAWFVVIVNVACHAIVLFIPLGPGVDAMRDLFIGSFPDNTAALIFLLITFIYQYCAWSFPTGVVAVFIAIVNDGFKMLDEAFRVELEKNGKKFPPKFREFRLLHLKLTRAVELIDKDLKFLFALWYVTNIPLGCFIMYNLLKGSPDTFTSGVLIFWFTCGIAIVIVSSLFATTLNNTAHAPLVHLFNIETNGLSTEQLCQVQLFMGKLTGRSIGMTVMDFVVVTKEMFLTLGGLFLTYFFLVLQFGV